MKDHVYVVEHVVIMPLRLDPDAMKRGASSSATQGPYFNINVTVTVILIIIVIIIIIS